MVSSADGICVSECRCPAFLWKCGGGNCIWPGPDGLSEAEIKKRTEDCLHLFGLEKLRDRPPYHLSGGEKRKVSLACILSLNSWGPDFWMNLLQDLMKKHRICWWIFCRVFIKQEKRWLRLHITDSWLKLLVQDLPVWMKNMNWRCYHNIDNYLFVKKSTSCGRSTFLMSF